jgi:hypothetical protein
MESKLAVAVAVAMAMGGPEDRPAPAPAPAPVVRPDGERHPQDASWRWSAAWGCWYRQRPAESYPATTARFAAGLSVPWPSGGRAPAYIPYAPAFAPGCGPSG